jgi:hypothetical protein
MSRAGTQQTLNIHIVHIFSFYCCFYLYFPIIYPQLEVTNISLSGFMFIILIHSHKIEIKEKVLVILSKVLT